MNTSEWIQVGSLGVDIIKTIIPFGFIFLIFWLFNKELKGLIKNGGWKVTAPGVSIETLQKQQERLGAKEKKEIIAISSELDTAKDREKKLRELQEYTARDKDTFFLGYHFEKTYRLIFPSQMLILNALKNTNAEMSDALARAIFRRTIWALHYNATYEQFINFLVESALIEYNSDQMKLSPLGKTFMEYLTSNNIPFKIPANDMIIEEPQTVSNQ